MKILIYDIEIIKAVPDKKFPVQEGVEYCAGWQDHANMGVSVIGAYDYASNRYRTFCADNFDEFRSLKIKSDTVVTFNGIGFDDKVLSACSVDGVSHPNHYDILRELWLGAGLGPEFIYPSHIGFGLEAVGMANFGLSKTGNGALAPVDWQQGKIGSVIDYCLNDVALTKRCFDRIRTMGGLLDPRDSSHFIEMRRL